MFSKLTEKTLNIWATFVKNTCRELKNRPIWLHRSGPSINFTAFCSQLHHCIERMKTMKKRPGRVHEKCSQKCATKQMQPRQNEPPLSKVKRLLKAVVIFAQFFAHISLTTIYIVWLPSIFFSLQVPQKNFRSQLRGIHS